MGSLRHLYRRNVVEKQIRWKCRPAVDLSPAPGLRAALVARRHAHRIRWFETGRAYRDLCDSWRWRPPGATHVRGKRPGSILVKRWKCAHVRSIPGNGPGIREDHVVGSEDTCPDAGRRLTGNLLPSLVSGWPLRSSAERRRLSEIDAVGFVYATVAPVGRQDGSPWLLDLVAGQQIHRL